MALLASMEERYQQARWQSAAALRGLVLTGVAWLWWWKGNDILDAWRQGGLRIRLHAIVLLTIFVGFILCLLYYVIH
jgi:hypothetical protein